MYEFHGDKKRYFDIQTENAEQYVIPFIEEKFQLKTGMRVLEIGCGEGGVMRAFINRGCECVGVELDAPRVETGKVYMADAIAAGHLKFITKDIYKVDIDAELGGKFDIIVLKDVIEHIYDQEKLITWMKSFLKENGIIFFGFPPWYMPYGGHQQMCKSKISKLPYIHLLPRSLYKWILTKNKEQVAEFMEIVDTQISIERFEKICTASSYYFQNKRHYLINPIYKWKFGWNARPQFKFIAAIPFFRNFVTTCVYYTISPKR